ncbi:MAG: flagellar hook-associated protein FlgK [Gemmatimonadaceae bacterium]
MSIGSILNMARSAMNAQQMAIQIASENVSNATTKGYSKQTVDLANSLPVVFPFGSVGTGVTIAGITRARDSLLDQTFRQDSAGASSADAKSGALSQIQSLIGEPSDTGLSTSLDAFWGAWSNLSSNPTNAATKSVVIETGQNVANTLNRFASQLDNLDQNNREAMNVDVNKTNELLNTIAKYNSQIVAAESNGTTANDLRDARDNVLDQLSTIVGGQIIEHPNGSVAVYANGQMLVDDTTVKPIQMNDGQPPTVTYKGSTALIQGFSGTLGAEIEVSTTEIPKVISQLDSLAKGLVTTVNSIHSAGTVFSGSPPVGSPAGNFFDTTASPPAGGDPLLTARGIRVLSTLTTDGIASSGPSATGPGDNNTALALAGLQTGSVSFTSSGGAALATTSFGAFYNSTVGMVATSVQQSQDDSTVQSTLASNADTQRQSVSGVSTDEELVALIQHQHAYQAAARLVTVVSDMADTLINLGR